MGRKIKSKYLSHLEVNPIARKVKMADLNDNLNLNRIKNPTKKDNERMVKYRKAMEFLKDDKAYKVYVDEYFHYKDSSHRYLKGYYVDCQAAYTDPYIHCYVNELSRLEIGNG